MVARTRVPRAAPDPINVNSVVSYNMRAIREQRGWTQLDLARRLGSLTGRELTQASISAMERTFFDTERRRLFDAHELYLLSVVFDVPIIYFFLPPPDLDVDLAGTGRPLAELYASVLGHDAQLPRLDQRLADIAATNPGRALRVLASIYGVADTDIVDLPARFRAWREQRLAHLEGEYGPRMAAAVEVLARFAAAVKAARADAWLGSADRSRP